jgi:hypothetical protein
MSHAIPASSTGSSSGHASWARRSAGARSRALDDAPVVAQVSRSPWRAQLRRLPRGCHIEPFASEQAHDVGALVAKAGTADVADAHAILTAAWRGATVLTQIPATSGACRRSSPRRSVCDASEQVVASLVIRRLSQALPKTRFWGRESAAVIQAMPDVHPRDFDNRLAGRLIRSMARLTLSRWGRARTGRRRWSMRR